MNTCSHNPHHTIKPPNLSTPIRGNESPSIAAFLGSLPRSKYIRSNTNSSTARPRLGVECARNASGLKAENIQQVFLLLRANTLVIVAVLLATSHTAHIEHLATGWDPVRGAVVVDREGFDVLGGRGSGRGCRYDLLGGCGGGDDFFGAFGRCCDGFFGCFGWGCGGGRGDYLLSRWRRGYDLLATGLSGISCRSSSIREGDFAATLFSLSAHRATAIISTSCLSSTVIVLFAQG